MLRFFAKMSAINVVLLGGLIFLALSGSRFMPESWQIFLSWRQNNDSWQTDIIDVERQLTFRAYIPSTNERPFLSPDRRFVINIDTGRRMILHDLSLEQTYALPIGIPAIWSPDSRHFSYYDVDSESPTFSAILFISIDENGLPGDPVQVYLNDTAVTYGYMEWSPDGQWLAIRSSDAGFLLADADGRNPRRLMDDTPYFDWAPDSQHIAYVSSGTTPSPTNDFIYPYNINIINLDGTEERMLVEDFFDGVPELDWSPDGQFIAFINYSGRGLYVMNVNTNAMIGPLDTGQNLQALNMQWSPDSERIIFDAIRPGGIDLYTVRRDGSNLQRLTDGDKIYRLVR